MAVSPKTLTAVLLAGTFALVSLLGMAVLQT